ncbi:MAG TPA: hypothetical protein VGO90_10175 [Chthoniobacteraceae bacterium]|jgi:hypothetical protein|nr:hypothetical protein [Chthoniobacter sp.]HEV7868038.1 hypothetical protein [Chthoniobacteraceae bacterium]
MITISGLREHLAATPFEPFRIFPSDGSHHDVPHPEFAWVIGNRMLVAKIVPERGPEDPAIKELSVPHVTGLEPLPKTKRRRSLKK